MPYLIMLDDGNQNFDRAIATAIIILISAITIPFLIVIFRNLIRGDYIGWKERYPILVVVGFTLLLAIGWMVLLFIR